MSSKNLTFKVNWVGDSHIVVGLKKQDEDNIGISSNLKHDI